MVVEKLKRKRLILPLILGVLFVFLYAKLPLKYFVFLFLGFVGAIFTLYDVKLGILLEIFILPFVPDMLNLLFMIFVIFAFIYRQSFRKHNPLTKNSIDVPIVLFVIAIIFSTITSINPQGSFRDLAIHLVSIGFVFVIINSIKNKKDFNVMLTIIVITATLVSLYGLYQYKVGVKMEDKWLDVANNPGITTRVFSVFGNPNILAEYLIMIIPISLALFWYSKRMHKKFIFLLTSLILMLTLVLTLSRGGWLGFAFGIFIFVVLVEKRLLLLAIPLVVGLVYLLPPTILNRILSIKNLSDSSNAYRIKIWQLTLKIIKDHWLSGVGFGYIPFKQTFETYIRTMPAYHAHNTYLETTAEMGIIGFILLVIFIFVIYKYAIKTLLKSKDKYIRIMAGGVLAGLSAVLFHGLVENVLYLPRIIITFWTLISFILVLMRIESKEIS